MMSWCDTILCQDTEVRGGKPGGGTRPLKKGGGYKRKHPSQHRRLEKEETPPGPTLKVTEPNFCSTLSYGTISAPGAEIEDKRGPSSENISDNNTDMWWWFRYLM